MSSVATPGRSRRGWLGAVGVVVLAVLGVGWYGHTHGWWTTPAPPPPVDMTAVLRANNEGLGHLERYEYVPAAEAFEQVVRLAPDWVPGRVNLGIALFNLARGQSGAEQEASQGRAVRLFQEVLRQEPDNPYAHYCLGVILYDVQGNPGEAALHFEEVTRIDPQDAHAWYWLGRCQPDDGGRAVPCYQRAVELNPYLNGALETLYLEMRRRDPAKAEALLLEKEALRKTDWTDPVDPKYYTDLGRYARVVTPAAPRGFGPLPLFTDARSLQVQLAPGARWATAADFGKGPAAEVRARVRARFGANMVVLDYNRDGLPDLLLLGAVVEGGKVRDLLLRNEGAGRFTDVTAAAGLAGERPSLGCCVADFDNDGYPDLFITGVGEQHLFRNTTKGRFEDVTAKAGLGGLRAVCLGACALDLDQDSDLDLVVTRYADTPEEALAALAGKAPAGGPGVAVFINVGEALPRKGAQAVAKEPLLDVRFRAWDGAPVQRGLQAAGGGRPGNPFAELRRAVGLAVSDLDTDHDVDLLVLGDAQPAGVVRNDRLLRFRGLRLPESVVGVGPWNGALVLDADQDGRSDLFLVAPDRPPRLLLNRAKGGPVEAARWFEQGAVDSPPLLQAHAIDLDLDGWPDVVGLSAQRRPVLLHNQGGRLLLAPMALGTGAGWPKDLIAVAVADFDGDSVPDVLVWSEASGLRLQHNRGHNCGLALALQGAQGLSPTTMPMRVNADAIGARVTAHAGSFSTTAEVATRSAGLGQSSQPLWLGLGEHSPADVVQVHWPDGTWQAELNVLQGPQVIFENNRKTTSCPLLFTWDGTRFRFVTDFLGAGSLGEPLPTGGHRMPRPEESVKIEPGQLAPLDGRYVLKLAEPMDEVTYLDRLQLVVLDHPPELRVFPDERFTGEGPRASQAILALGRPVFAARARDHRGRDVTAALAHWDRRTVDGFAHRSWIGFAEDHWVELDFGDRLAKFGPTDRLVLCLAGWTDYPYPESIWAAAQAGVAPRAPVFERRADDGTWRTLVADAGFPAGLPRMMTLDVTGKLAGPRCVVRLRTNMEIYWDQVYVAPLAEIVGRGPGRVRAITLEVADATLAARGCVQEFSPDGRQPTVYHYDRLAAVPVSRLAGRLTRCGDVAELLRETDDRFVIFGPGDEVTVRFDARRLPALPPGWARSFVLRTGGYCKDCSPFTATGDTIEPLPFRAMRAYPYGPDEHYPDDARHREYRERYNTRLSK